MKSFVRRAVTLAATLALTAGSALVATAPAQAVAVPEHEVSITKNSSKVTTSTTTGGKSWTVTATFTGPASDDGLTDVNGDGVGIYYYVQYPQIDLVKSRVASPSKPRVASASTGSSLKPGDTISITLQTTKYTSPGVYTIKVPVKQYSRLQDGTQWVYAESEKFATATFEIHANKKVSVAETGFSAPSWKTGATAKFTFRAPAYQRGAKVTLYVKKKGTKKYVKLASAKLKEDGYNSSTKIKGKKLRAGDKIYFKVAKATYSPAYKTKVVKIKKSW